VCVLAQIPNLERAPRIDRRARRIQDPVERLRYLRREMGRPLRRRPEILRHLSILAIPVMLAIAPRPNSAGSNETLALERRLLVPPATAAMPAVSTTVPRIWRVEHSKTTDVYSNGLRVELNFLVSNRPRARFHVYSLTGGTEPVKNGSDPVGIVFHTTESHLAPFQEEENRRLKQLGRNLVEGVRQERAYHYVIDRFGRVFNVVAESDAANHAGTSVWADSDSVYVNLNDSFFGVSFEGQTGATDEVTPAQIASARVLTEMLRSRYGIRAENCVTHAQVSVNPFNMRIGAHTDWAAAFPFGAIGLPDNYILPPASIYAFGFEFDSVFLRAAGGARWKGLEAAAQIIDKQAQAQHLPVEQYRAGLRERYKEIAAAIKKENSGGI
jgi:hypothetical protein